MTVCNLFIYFAFIFHAHRVCMCMLNLLLRIFLVRVSHSLHPRPAAQLQIPVTLFDFNIKKRKRNVETLKFMYHLDEAREKSKHTANRIVAQTFRACVFPPDNASNFHFRTGYELPA